MDNGMKIKSMGRGSMCGLMEGDMRETGKIITCMVGEYTHGKMVGDMRESTRMIGSMGKGHIPGLTADST